MTDAIRSALEAARAQLINLNDAIDDFWNDPTRPSVATMRSGTVSNLSIAQLDARASLAKIDAALASLDAPQPDALREAENAVSHAFGLLSSAVRCGEAWRQELDDAKDRARAASGEREGEIQKEKANETAETVVRMELQGSQQRIVSARPELVADHVAAVPQGVSLCADRGEAVTPSPSPTPAGESDSGLVERLRWEAQFTNAIAARSLREAADRIEQQAAEIRRLTEKQTLFYMSPGDRAREERLFDRIHAAEARAEQAERERDERREIARKWFDECFAAKSALSASEARVKELQHAAMNACAAMRGVVAIEKKNEFAVVRHALAALRQALEGDGRAVLRKEGK